MGCRPRDNLRRGRERRSEPQEISIFIKAPSIEALRERLEKRGTDSPEAIAERVAKAAEELTYAPKFDYVLVNDDLPAAFAEAEKVVEDFLDDGKLNYSTII